VPTPKNLLALSSAGSLTPFIIALKRAFNGISKEFKSRRHLQCFAADKGGNINRQTNRAQKGKW
jgi:hypothetical protein